MALYPFTNIKTGETQDIFYHMKDVPSIGAVVEIDGQKWKRGLTTSQLAMAGLKPIDPHSAKDFVRKTGQMKGGTVGDLWDTSKRMSEQRAEKMGKDPIKQDYYDQYAKKRKGHRHTAEKAEMQKKAAQKANEKMKAAGITISLT